MPLKSLIRACWVMGLIVACAAADHKPSLIGATRDEVLARFGEPKSNIVAGNREVLFFTGERVVLRNDRVIEVEEIPVEPPPPKPAPAMDSTAPLKETSATPASAPAESAGAPGEALPTSSSTPAVHEPVPAAPSQPSVFIKSVRPPGKETVPTSRSLTPTPVPAPEHAASTPPVAAVVAEPSPARTEPITAAATPAPANAAAGPAASAPTTSSAAADAATAPIAQGESPVAPEGATSASAADSAADSSATTTATASAPATVQASSTGRVQKAPETHEGAAKTEPGAAGEPTESASLLNGRAYLLGLAVIVLGVGFLIWRRRQRSLLLEATAVSNTPFAVPTPAAVTTAARFTQELLNKLEWKRFEELVASYYNKTGVVAARTKSGPASAVHIRISWKGEQRPFACVHCIPHPSAVVDAKPLQRLCEVLAAEDIRRGYVVTAGKFGVPARDLAEEKNITLLSGDLFLEKLNTLPDAARQELMRDATAGDYVTPSCPTCESKMTRSAADPTGWECPQCGTTLPKF